MDTRTKIVGSEEAARLAAEGAVVVKGYFDPLVAASASRLRELKGTGRKLIVMIADPPDPILPTRARAELVAALAAVDYVVESDKGLTATVDLRDEHAQAFEELVEHVHRRRGAA